MSEPVPGRSAPGVVHPMPVPPGLALLRAASTVTGWAILTLPIFFAALLIGLGVETLRSGPGTTPFSETDLGDHMIGAVMGAAAVVSALALTLNLVMGLLVSAAHLRMAEAVAPQERLSAQDARLLGSSASQRLTVLLALVAAPALVIGALGAIIVAVENDPEFGGWRTAPALLVPGTVIAIAVLVLRSTTVPAARARIDALAEQWPQVASRPEPLLVLAAREREAPSRSMPSARQGRRRAEVKRTSLPLSPKQFLVGVFGSGLATGVLMDVLGITGTWLALPLLLFGLGAVSAAVMAIRAAVRSARGWAAMVAGVGAERATVHDYARRHPCSVPAALGAIVGGVTSALALSDRWMPEFTEALALRELSTALGTPSAALFVISLVLSTTEHMSTRRWRQQYLAAHPDHDPWWELDLNHDGYEEIRGWLTG